MKKENLQATRKSIRHWMLDIRRPLMTGDQILFLGYDYSDKSFEWSSSQKRVPCGGESCDLCKINNHHECNGCPLMENGTYCGDANSPYNTFYNNPNFNTATDMVRALVRAYWAEKERKND